MDAETAALLFGLARAGLATLQLHQPQEAVTSLSRVFGYYVNAGDVDRAVAVSEYPLPIIPGLTGATQLISRALALVPPDSQVTLHIYRLLLIITHAPSELVNGTDRPRCRELPIWTKMNLPR